MLKAEIKNFLSKNMILPFNKGRRFIFTYHDISDSSSVQYSPEYSTSVQRFMEQITFLSGIFEWVDLKTINRKEKFTNNVAAITFDDGFKSVETHALPFLKKNNIPFSVFVNQRAMTKNRLWVTDLHIDKKKFKKDYHLGIHFENNDVFKTVLEDPSFNNSLGTLTLNANKTEQIFLNAEDVLKLKNNGVLIGNHGSLHLNLNRCNENTLYEEIVDNKSYLEKIIKDEVTHYSIAFGKKEHYNKKAIQVIQKSGHTHIYNSNPRSFSERMGDQLIPRIGLTEHTPAEIMFYINRQFIKKMDL